MLPQIDRHIDRLTWEREWEMREAQSVWTPKPNLGESYYARVRLSRRIARERKKSNARLAEALRIARFG